MYIFCIETTSTASVIVKGIKNLHLKYARGLQGDGAKLKLTDAEDAVIRFVVDAKKPLTTIEVSESIGKDFPSLKYRTHSSAALNSLVSKGILGKYKDGYIDGKFGKALNFHRIDDHNLKFVALFLRRRKI